jgi:hypothetical protein
MSLQAVIAQCPLGWRPRTKAFPDHHASDAALTDAEAVAEARVALPVPGRFGRIRAEIFDGQRRGDWSALTALEWRYALQSLTRDDRAILEDHGFAAALLAAPDRDGWSDACYNRLAEWYLQNFEPGLSLFEPLGEVLVRELSRLHLIFQAIHNDLEAFHPARFLERSERVFFEQKQSIIDLLGFRGQSTVYAAGPLFAVAFIHICRRIAGGHISRRIADDDCNDRETLSRLTEWGLRRTGFRYQAFAEARRRFIEALLIPWSHHYPGPEIAGQAIRAVARLLPAHPLDTAAWVGVDPRAPAVYLAWLSRDTIQRFFAICRTTIPHQAGLEWDERERFWLERCDALMVQNAWMALGRKITEAVQADPMAWASAFPLAFGQIIRDVAGNSTQSVLLLKLQDLTVAEWSHNEGCHVWGPGSQLPPQLNQDEYAKGTLRTGASFAIVHEPAWADSLNGYLSAVLAGQAADGQTQSECLSSPDQPQLLEGRGRR